MSITGSIVGYENNNEIGSNKRKRRSILPLHNCSASSAHNSMGKNCTPSLNSSISNSVITTASSSLSQQQQHHQHQQHMQQQQLQQQKYMNSKRKHAKYSSMMMHPSHMDHNNYLHLNSLWSIWYGVLLTLFQGYLAVHGAYRFLGCSLIPWKIEPVAELNLQIVLSGVVFILLPLFFTSAVFKVGNLANDGIKLATGSKERRCSMAPHDGLEEEARGGTLRALWTHGGPTAAFVHIVIALCLLMPRLLLEARIIENGLLPRENIWQTELDFIAVNRRNLVVLSVVTSPYQNISSNIEDEDYYNDTMFTALGNVNSNINNNLLETSTKLEKQAPKTRFFEVPDLINRESTEDTNYEDITARAGAGPTNSVEENTSGRISVEQFDSNEFLLAKSLNPQTTTSTTTTTTGSSSSSAPTTTTTSTTTTAAGGNNRVVHRNYDKTWDKLATLDKGNSLPEPELPAFTSLTTSSTADKTTSTSTAGSTTTSTTTTNLGTKATTSTTTGATSTTTAETSSATAVVISSTDISSSSSSTTTTTTTTDNAAPSSTSTQTIYAPPTKLHSPHQHQHHQHQHHSHSSSHSHAGKATRKHVNRQHRQRGQHHRRHHTTATATSAGSRSEEARSSRSEEFERATELRPLKPVDFNRLDDIDMSTVFEHTASGSFPHTKTSTLAGNRDPSSAGSYEELDSVRRTPHPKSTSTISTTTRDSNIHIVKPEMLPEIIPSTPVSSNSKIIEIKTKAKMVKRMADDELQVEIEPEYLIGDLPNNDSSEYSMTAAATPAPPAAPAVVANSDPSTAATTDEANSQASGLVRLDGFAGMLQIFFGIEKPIDVAVFAHPPSAEFINLLFALLVWCVRYPAVFWATTKPFATIFSIQMIAAALDIIFSYIGASNLYKLQVYSEAMPIVNPGLILNGVVTLALFLLSTALLIASSMIMYLYGHGRLAAKMRDRSLITMKSSETWIYFAHCASLCFVLALAVVKAPLLNDLSATYRNNLHCPTFLSALISVVHLLLWIVIWLGLTAKRRWTFKLPPVDTYGITKATTQPLLMPNRNSIPSSGGGGGGGSVTGIGGGCGSIDQKGVISNASSIDGGGSGGGGVEDIYWPKLAPNSPKLKVTFNEVTSTSDDVLLIGDHEQTDGKRNSPRGTAVCFASAPGEIDDGEYATLRAATAATVVGIGMGGGGAGGLLIGGGNTPTGNVSVIGSGSVKILHLSEYDELPPPPPPQLMSTAATHNAGAHINNNNNKNNKSTTSGSISFADYANCIGLCDDNTSEEGKLLACVRDDSVTYASTRDLEPPHPPPPPPPPLTDDTSPTICSNSSNSGRRAPHAMPEIMQLSSSPEHLVSPLAPVSVTVHTNEAHIASSSTPRCLRRADSGVPNEALTPRSDTTSTTESTTSPPERAPSESSSGVHSGEERDVEVVIRPRAACKPPPKPPQPPIQEEPYGRCTNMRMSSFVAEPVRASNSATLPLTRSAPEQRFDYSHCSTMPLPVGCHSQQQQHQQQQQHALMTGSSIGYSTSSGLSMHPQSHMSSFKTQVYANSAVAMAGAHAARQQQLAQLLQQQQGMHTTLPNGVRYSNPHFLRRLPHVTKAAESPYGHLGLGAGHHTFSKLLHDPLQGSLANSSIPEDRDSANYSMSSDQDCNLYATANHLN